MSTWATRLTRSTVLGIIAEVLARVANTIFFFIIARKAGEAEAGAYALGFTFALILMQCALGGLDQFMLREVAYQSDQTGKIVGQCLFARFVTSLLVYMVFVVWLRGSAHGLHVQAILALLGATVISESVSTMYQSYLIAEQRVEWTVLISGFSGVLKLVGILATLLIGIDAIVAASMVLATSVIALFCYILVAGRYLPPAPWRLTWAFWRRYAGAAAPFFFVALLGMFEASIDTLLLEQRYGTRMVGLYNAAGGLIAGLVILPRVLRQVLLPIVTRAYVEMRGKIGMMLEQLMRVLGGAALFISITLIGSADILMNFFSRAHFIGAAQVLQVMACSFVITMITLPNGRVLAAAGKQRIFVPLQIVSTVSTIAFNLALQPWLGAVGAALGDGLAALIVFALGAMYVQLRLVRWPILRTLTRLALAGLPFALTLLGLRAIGIHWLLALLAGWTVYAAGMWGWGVVTRHDLQWMQAIFAQHYLSRRSLPNGANR
ncbi:MAG: flippase [Herpetosiphon sp.]